MNKPVINLSSERLHKVAIGTYLHCDLIVYMSAWGFKRKHPTYCRDYTTAGITKVVEEQVGKSGESVFINNLEVRLHKYEDLKKVFKL